MEPRNKYYGPRFNIHTTLDKYTYLFFEDFKEKHKCNLNTAIEHVVAYYVTSNEETKGQILNAVVDKVIEKYYHEHIEHNHGKTKK